MKWGKVYTGLLCIISEKLMYSYNYLCKKFQLDTEYLKKNEIHNLGYICNTYN